MMDHTADERLWLSCDDCHEAFEVEYCVALSLWQFQEDTGAPILCPVCLPEGVVAAEEYETQTQTQN